MATKCSFSTNGKTVDYFREEYQLNDSTGKYEKLSTGVPFHSLPAELWTEEAQDEVTRRYSNGTIITGRIRNKTRLFYTGLRNTPFTGYLHGNDSDKSEVCFRFWQSDKRLTVFYFRKIRVYPTHVNAFYSQFLTQLHRQPATV
jgi:hypothetical protein